MDAVSILMSFMIVFFGNATGTPVSFGMLAIVLLANTLLSIGCPGVPGGAIACFAALSAIAGLPADSYDGFCRSVDTVAALNPANITVHTLALKKGADLFEKRENLPTAQDVTRMVDFAGDTLRSLGYKPYYLYRQKYMSGSFENVGWSRDGLDCLYNIYMMEEVHSILSLGGGGMNKVNFPDGSLQRFHNPKFPEQYIAQIDSVLRQKEELFELMKEGI